MVKKTASALSATCCIVGLFLLMAPLASRGDEGAGVLDSQCHGHPNWCVRVSNESREAIEVYLDGEHVGDNIITGKFAWFIIPPGSHQVHACLLNFFSKKCLPDETIQFGSDQSIEVRDPR